MKKLNTQMIAVEKVLKEMEEAEKNIGGWNAFWWEKYEDTVLPQEYFDRPHWENENLGKEVSKIDSATYTDKYMGIPLRHIMLGNKYSCDVNTIVWTGIMTHHSTRKIRFCNNGDITLEKISNKKQTQKYPTTISYDARYNVLSDDFDISITLDELVQDGKIKKHKYDNFNISLNGNILTEKSDNIEITKDLSNGKKLVKIIKRNSPEVVFEATLNPDDSLEKGRITVNTHKSDGKVNRTYRFYVSRKKGIQANFCSRKGVKFDLTESSELMDVANQLLLTIGHKYKENIAISSFISLVQEKMNQNLTIVDIDSTDFVESIKQLEENIIATVKGIKGELPLLGLTERIDNCLTYKKIGKKLMILKY